MIKPLILAMGLLGFASLATAEDASGIIRAAVLQVVDGDTIVIEQSGIPLTIDLESIDAPELNQAFGQEAKSFLTTLIGGKNITIQQVKTVEYRHITGFVKLEDLEVNRNMISSGLAWYDIKNGYDSLLKDIQKQAEAAKIGLWSDKKAVAPWEYRNGPKEAFKLPDIAVSYEGQNDGVMPAADAPIEGSGSQNVKLDQILGAKVPAFTPPPPVPAGPAATQGSTQAAPVQAPAPEQVKK